ncbi:MAG: cardiolipin synthase [Oscillospiraceae bacterium]
MKKLASLVLHRLVFMALAMILQLGVLIVMMVRFGNYFFEFYGVCIVLSLLAVLWIVGNDSNPAYKIAWIVPIMLVPVFGGVIYLLFGRNRLSRRNRKYLQVMEERMVATLSPDFAADTLTKRAGACAAKQSHYMEQSGHCPVYENTAIAYYPLGDDSFQPMLDALRSAEHYIFIEYFIIQKGIFWNSITDILKEKVKQGVDVRVLYDDIGCMYTLPKGYPKELAADGIQCAVFNPFVPVLSTILNNRDHRKICVVDGKIAFTGGVNLSDEYINVREKYGHWKDSAIRLEGDAVWSMTVMFLTMWDFVHGTEGDYEGFRPHFAEKPRGDGLVQPYTDCPWDDEPVGETVYLNLISNAEKYVYITTPYLIIDSAITTALVASAKSGVDVRIMTPHIPDKKVIFEVTRAHYEALLAGGVQIYEYTPGFVHGKNFAVDDKFGTVGSVNMDYRSMFLHFENGVWLCDVPAIAEIREDFTKTLEQCQPVTLAQCKSLPLWQRLLRDILRVFAPLM